MQKVPFLSPSPQHFIVRKDTIMFKKKIGKAAERSFFDHNDRSAAVMKTRLNVTAFRAMALSQPCGF